MTRPIATSLLGVLAAAAGQTLSVIAVGPVVRYAFGAPLDFDSDYTSPDVLRQALLIQGICGILAFFALGCITNAWDTVHGIRWSALAANPLVVGFGFWIYRALVPEAPDEYSGNAMWMLVSLCGPILYAPAALLGVRFRRKLRGRT